MEIKGIISLGRIESTTCCDSVQDLNIGGKSLYDALEEYFNLDAEKFWEDSNSESPKYSLRYALLDDEPKEEMSLSEAVVNILYAEHISGCYSEYTCGFGGFDYVINDGHSIFKELESSVGKYIIFKI